MQNGIAVNWYALNKIFYLLDSCIFYRFRKNVKGCFSAFLNMCAKYSFGIYFCHLYIAYLYNKCLTYFAIFQKGGLLHLFICFFYFLGLFIVIENFVIHKDSQLFNWYKLVIYEDYSNWSWFYGKT